MQNFQNQKSLIQFEPAQLFTNEIWYVQYKVLNPFTGKMVRKRNKLNRIKSITERKKYAKQLINTINNKLYNGWNPFLEEAAPNGFSLLTDVLDRYLKIKLKELRPNSIRSYKSYVNFFHDWLLDYKLTDLYVVSFGEKHATDVLNYIYDVKNVSQKTYNNYLLFFKTFWNWLIDQKYCSKSPFAKKKSKKEAIKDRVLIPREERTLIKEYFKKNNYQMYIASLLVFHTLIRPTEIGLLKREHFNFELQTIRITPNTSKNGKGRITTIPDVILGELIAYNFNGAGNQEYIFGLRGKPSKKPLDAREFTREWAKMRKKLNLDDKMKFYSLRDSGIVQLLVDGVSPHEVMKQAGHSSLEVTTVYLKHANPTGSIEIKEKNSSF